MRGQAIHSFTGASAGLSLPDLAKDFPEAAVLGLHSSHRCAPALLQRARALVRRALPCPDQETLSD